MVSTLLKRGQYMGVMVDGKIFREYDIRGIVGDDITENVVNLIGKAFGTYIKRNGGKQIVVGRDVRLSSEMFDNALSEGIIASGCDVISIGEVPTPIVYFSMFNLPVDGGIVVTASHNPKEYNGLKFRKGHFPFYGKEIQELRKIIETNDFMEGKGKRSEHDNLEPYLDAIRERIKFKRGLKVVVDAGNGTTGTIAPGLLKELGCEVVELYCTPDGNFPHHLPDPTVPEYMADLTEKVKEEKADLGIGFDGDGDRIGVIDNRGEMIWGDKLLILYGREILNREKASVVFDVKCSQALIEEIERMGGKAVMSSTGYPLVQAKMREHGALLGGEMSGHMYFSDNYYGFDDAVFAACRLLEILSSTERSLSEIMKDFPVYYATPEIRADCPDEVKFGIANELKNYFEKKYDAIDIDGIRILFGDGWALIRPSNTQPAIVLRFEAKTEERLEEIKGLVRDKLKEFSSVVINF